jgi:glucose/mannose-6-phosphate isomerase
MESRATLDDPAALAAGDPGGMLGLIARLGEQLRAGFELGASNDALGGGEPGALAICGMGGSAIAGDLLRAVSTDRFRYPVVVLKGYGLPLFCDGRTTVFALSYSGNTEETIAAWTEAVDRGCRVVAISSGGSLAALARERGRPHVLLPQDIPAPRAALGYLFGALLGCVRGGDRPAFDEELHTASAAVDDLVTRFGPGVPTGDNEAKSVAYWLAGRTPVIWGSEGIAEAASLRWKTQMNENAKVPAFHSSLPELDHNEVEGWSSGIGHRFAAIALRHAGEHPRISARLAATIEAVAPAGLEVRQVVASGDSPLAALLSLIAIGDLASTYLAILREVDPTPVPVLSGLKARLST